MAARETALDFSIQDRLEQSRATQFMTLETEIDEVENSQEPADGDLLPWADPYIARLVRRHELQCAQQRRNRQPYEGEPTVRFAPRAEAPVPLPSRTAVPKSSSRYNRQPRPATPAKPTHSK